MSTGVQKVLIETSVLLGFFLEHQCISLVFFFPVVHISYLVYQPPYEAKRI